METIVIGFSRPKAWFEPFSWLIRLFLRTPYSHVYIRFHSDPYDRDLVFQASSLHVNFYSWEIFQSVEDVIQEFTIPVTQDTQKDIIQFAMDTAGVPYNWSGIFGIVWAWLLSEFRIRVGNQTSGSGDFCSQLVGQIMVQFLGYTLDAATNLETPKDIFQFLVAKV